MEKFIEFHHQLRKITDKLSELAEEIEPGPEQNKLNEINRDLHRFRAKVAKNEVPLKN